MDPADIDATQFLERIEHMTRGDWSRIRGPIWQIGTVIGGYTHPNETVMGPPVQFDASAAWLIANHHLAGRIHADDFRMDLHLLNLSAIARDATTYVGLHPDGGDYHESVVLVRNDEPDPVVTMLTNRISARVQRAAKADGDEGLPVLAIVRQAAWLAITDAATIAGAALASPRIPRPAQRLLVAPFINLIS